MTRIAALGAGRMGRGIAVVFAYAGHPVSVVDFKPRPAAAFQSLVAQVTAEIAATLGMLHRIGLIAQTDAAVIAARIAVIDANGAAAALAEADLIFEGLPEILTLKQEALARASAQSGLSDAAGGTPAWSPHRARDHRPAEGVARGYR